MENDGSPIIDDIDEGEDIQDKSNDDISLQGYELSVMPNDFNLTSIFNFIEKGVFIIPPFQRNYVWDIKMASRLIESLLIGIPIPQVFLYEEAKNQFLIIDGQQRLLTIYYFIKGRFPKEEARIQLRTIFADNKGIPDDILANNEYFQDFKLKLPENLPGNGNKYNNKT